MTLQGQMNNQPDTAGSSAAQVFHIIAENVRAHRAMSCVLAFAMCFGILEFLLWGRTHLEDGIPLLILLFLAAFQLLKTSVLSLPSARGRHCAWGLLVPAGLLMACAAIVSRINPAGSADLLPALCKNGAILCLAVAAVSRLDGFPAAFKLLPILLLAVLVLPLYELLLLEFSYPLRLVSTAVSVGFLRLFCSVSYDGTSLFYGHQTMSITDACSGISLIALFLLLEYLILLSVRTDSWKKWAWASLLLLWVILGNASRLLLTFLLYRIWGERVFEADLHFLLGCFFVVVTSLLIWFSSFLFNLEPNGEAS